MNTEVKNFSASNPNFYARIVIFVLAILAAIGIQFPTGVDELGNEIVTSISTSGLASVIGLMAISVIMPIYNYIRKTPKPKVTWSTFFGSPNFVIYLITFLTGLLILVGVAIPEGTAEQVAGFIFAKDWGALLAIIFTNILDPLIRYFRDKKKAQLTS